MQQQSQDALLAQHLRSFLGDIDPAALQLLRGHLTWVEIAGGDTLMAQGDPGDSMYFSISGRLRAYVRDEDGTEHMVREMARGQIIGEMSLYTDEPRSATVVAIRDSVLVRLSKSEFGHLLASSAEVSIALTRQLIKRLQMAQLRTPLTRPITIALLPISAGVDVLDIGARLAAQLGRWARVRVVDAARLEHDLRLPGLAQCDERDTALNRAIALHLDDVEAENDYVLLLGDARPTPWTRRCSRRCDELLLLADASEPPVLHDTELRYLMRRPGRTEAAETLVLLHPVDRHCPSGTRQWLARRPVASHLHIRPALERDMARLARFQSRTAIGLVLAGGGARGLAHLGVYQALLERGIEVDCLGGTSIGSVMAALMATDQPLPDLMKVARKAFGFNPTGDFNFLPLLSLIKGRRLRQAIEAAMRELLGGPVDVEDLWKTCYCVATNYSQATEHLVRHGPLDKALLASISIPGALPPVLHDGDLLCDGGTFNNFPVDVMRGMRGVGSVIGVDLSFRKTSRIEHDNVPGSWALLRDRLRPLAKRRYDFPSLLAYLVNVTILYSTSRQRAARKLTDLYFNPPLERVGMLQWDRFDSIVAQGHAHAKQVLDAMTAGALARFETRPALANVVETLAPPPDST